MARVRRALTEDGVSMLRKNQLFMMVVLLAYWLVISPSIDFEHLVVGLVLVSMTVFVWRDLFSYLPTWPSWRALPRLMHLILSMVRSIIEANIAVAKVILSRQTAEPVFVVMRPPVESDWGRVILANCITLTPGTVTIDVNPDTGEFVVHALNKELADGLSDWQVVREIRSLELWKRGRLEHGMAISGDHGADVLRASKGNSGSNSH